MAPKYSSISQLQTEKGMQYTVIVDILDREVATYRPAVGTVATWTPTTAYIMSVELKPSANHYKMILTARDIDLVSHRITDKGKEFSKNFYILAANLSASLPVFAETATWTPEASYVWAYTVDRLGDNYILKVTAVTNGTRVM